MNRSPKRGRKVRPNKKRPKTASAKITKKSKMRVGTSKKSSVRPPRPTMQAPREVEIDEERERAGRNEPAFNLTVGGAVDSVAEELGEGFVLSVTSGGQAVEEIRDEELPEEEGGPFVETSAWTEFARGTDASNPADAEPADLPTVSPFRRN